MVRLVLIALFALSCMVCFADQLNASPIGLKAVPSVEVAPFLVTGFTGSVGPILNPGRPSSVTSHLQKRSSGDGSRPRKLTSIQKRRREETEMQRTRAQLIAALGPMSDSEVLEKLARKSRHHFDLQNQSQVYNEIIKQVNYQKKWNDRGHAIRNDDQDEFLARYNHYKDKENNDVYNLIKKAEAKRLKEYYRRKLRVDPEAGQAPSAIAVPPSVGQDFHYDSVPADSAFDFNQYHGSNWGGPGHNFD